MNKGRIMVVEDDRIIAEDIRLSLMESGYEVVAITADGSEAIRRVEEEKPDLVLMDIVLAGDKDGIETAAEIREHHQIPVVYLTSHADAATVERAKRSAPFGYLIKPFEANELNTTIELALYKHSMEQEREMLIQELRQALEQIETLEGLLPVCAWCKKIRDDEGYWSQIESYIERHSKARFSHSICPDCLSKRFPEMNG